MNKKANCYKILIVENNAVLRKGLGRLLNHENDIMACGYADSVDKALAFIEKNIPTLVIVDIYIQGYSSIHLIKEIKIHHPAIPVLVFSMHEKSLYAKLAIKAGAMGYITAQEDPETIIGVIRKVLEGGTYTSINLTESINDMPLFPV